MTETIDLVEVFEHNPEIDKQVAGLREAADWLNANAHLPRPDVSIYVTGAEIYWYFWHTDKDQLQRAAIIRRAIGGKWAKEYMGSQFRLEQRISDNLLIQIITQRDQVCTAKVVGTETVTIPAVEAQPERVEVRDVIDWECSDSLLAKE